LRKTRFLKKTTHLFFFKSEFFGYFEKKQVLFFLKKTTQKPHSELFLLHHAISPF